MPIDTSLYQNYLRPPKSIADYTAEAQQQQQNALALSTGRIANQNALRDQQESNDYREAAKGFGADATQNYNMLLQRGLPAQAAAYQKSALEGLKTRSDISLNSSKAGEQDALAKGHVLDQSIKAHDYQVQKLGAIANPADVPMWIAESVKSGVFTPEQAQAGMQRFQQALQQPGGFEAWKQQALQGGMTATAQLQQQQALLIANQNNATSRANNADTNATHIKTTGMSNAVTMRGQNMVDARTRESTVATMTKPFEVTGPDGTPMLVQQDKQGNISPVAGYGPKAGAAKPLNDSQAKALLFGSRMQESDKVLGNLEAKGVNTPSLTKMAAESVPFVGGALGAAANTFVASPDQQSVEQAQRDFVNAVLRRESGAAIAPSEFSSAAKQYFPAVGDSAQVKAQKAANRQLAIKGLLAEVPAGQRGSLSTPAAAPAAPAGWKIEKVN